MIATASFTNSASAQNGTLQQLTPEIYINFIGEMDGAAEEKIQALDNGIFTIGNILFINGTYSDKEERECNISYILNNKSTSIGNDYLPANAIGPLGTRDFSKWNVSLAPDNYGQILEEGQNKLTSKVTCLAVPPNEINDVKFRSLNFTAVRATELNPPINNTTALSSSNTSQPIMSNITNTAPLTVSDDKSLSINITMQENPMALEDDQNIEVGLYDAAGRQVVPVLAKFTILGSSGEPIDGGGYWGPNLFNSTDISYDFDLDEEVEPGIYTLKVEAWAATSSLQPPSKTISFNVIEEIGEGSE